ncbi:Holliday junction resolvase RuvX [Candidatus Persebacteraceae bacterium Df01]|uniref:Putative pre-16S rRNA nuclease n=1 Tax=Candidatus Doriopsillibacter californiensis TaxID=2970740 RepID=A0ABT7QLL9_9GAMM|nr:Holliday junction resolvase RuvX [Candidatus Persebacteraceae bacterium Df01]
MLLAIDVGRKKSGIAVGNTLTASARPLTTVRGGRSSQLTAIGELIRQWQPQQIIVGLPRHMDDTEHSMTTYCRDFARRLQEQVNLPVAFADERLTTQIVAHHADTDSAAASVILQSWLDAQARKEIANRHFMAIL